MDIALIIRILLYLFYWFIVFVCILTIIKELRDPSRALAWIVVVIAIPVGGILLFIFFGQNLRRRLIMFKREFRFYNYVNSFYKKQIKIIGELSSNNGLSDNQQLITLLLNNSRSILTWNNSVKILRDGKNTFEEIIKALENAKSSIHMEYYIFEEDELSRRICDILIKKVHEGITVRLLYDDVGSWKLSRKFVNSLKHEGIEIAKFFPVVFPLISNRINNRNHRKIVVVDGLIGFTGGVNIAKRYLSDNWHDTHLKITGDAVKMLQLIFMTDWNYATKQTIDNWQKYLPKCKTTHGNCPIQIAASGPSTPWASIMQAYFEAISKSRHSIYISTPYFTPTQPILTALKVASLGGVDVRIMLPEKSDVKLAQLATKSYFRELLDAGVCIYLYRDGFIHTKMICVDSNICSIGTVNMDERSFEDNYEVTAIMYDKAIIDDANSNFRNLCTSCHMLTLSEWESKRIHRNDFLEAICRLISPLL